MKRSVFLTICLAAGLSSVCFAQDHATGDANKLMQEEWQSRVNAARERVEQRREELRLEREKRYELKQEERLPPATTALRGFAVDLRM
jgi:hypothetical protein